MEAFFGLTDRRWFETLGAKPALDEVNFWRPGGQGFGAIPRGMPFLFKLKRPHAGGRDVIAGGGWFSHSSILPISVAWDAFGIKNGARSLPELRADIGRNKPDALVGDPKIGCIMLSEPYFFPPAAWVDIPDWPASLQSGTRFDLTVGTGKLVWDQVRSVFKGLVTRDTSSPPSSAKRGTSLVLASIAWDRARSAAWSRTPMDAPAP